MKNLIVFDIDGCIVDPSRRLHHLRRGDIDAYAGAWQTDTILTAGVTVYRAMLSRVDLRHVFVTGRPEADRKGTLSQLTALFGPSSLGTTVLMRPNGMLPSVVPDEKLKPKLLTDAGFKVEDVLVVFEDRQKIVDAWRAMGVTVFQTAKGDF